MDWIIDHLRKQQKNTAKWKSQYRCSLRDKASIMHDDLEEAINVLKDHCKGQ